MSTNGGGWFYEPLAGGGVGDRVNFGITATYQDPVRKKGARGNANIIRRARFDLSTLHPSSPSGTRDYNFHVKSNATSQFTIACTGSGATKICTSTFGGKATVKAVNRATGETYNVGDALGGNVSFQIDVTDAGEPGSSPGVGPDKFAARVRTTNGTILILDAIPNATYTSKDQILINGGNIQVRE